MLHNDNHGIQSHKTQDVNSGTKGHRTMQAKLASYLVSGVLGGFLPFQCLSLWDWSKKGYPPLPSGIKASLFYTSSVRDRETKICKLWNRESTRDLFKKFLADPDTRDYVRVFLCSHVSNNDVLCLEPFMSEKALVNHMTYCHPRGVKRDKKAPSPRGSKTLRSGRVVGGGASRNIPTSATPYPAGLPRVPPGCLPCTVQLGGRF